jgi:hypothetical protein
MTCGDFPLYPYVCCTHQCKQCACYGRPFTIEYVELKTVVISGDEPKLITLKEFDES